LGHVSSQTGNKGEPQVRRGGKEVDGTEDESIMRKMKRPGTVQSSSRKRGATKRKKKKCGRGHGRKEKLHWDAYQTKRSLPRKKHMFVLGNRVSRNGADQRQPSAVMVSPREEERL